MTTSNALPIAASPYLATINSAAAANNVPVALLQGLLLQENPAFNPYAVGSSGEIGLTQLMPGTAAGLGVSNPYDPTQQINAGAEYLAQGYAKTGNWTDALRYYNGGGGYNSSNTGYNGDTVANITSNYASSVLAKAGALGYTGTGASGSTGSSASSTTSAPASTLNPIRDIITNFTTWASNNLIRVAIGIIALMIVIIAIISLFSNSDTVKTIAPLAAKAMI